MTLTKTQKEIIRLMREGWELIDTGLYQIKIHMENDGSIRDVKGNHGDLMRLLLNNKLVKVYNYKGLEIIYTLTEKGRTVNIDQR